MIYCYKTELTLRRVIHLKKTKASCCNGTCDKRQKSSLTTTGLFAASRNLSSLVIQFFPCPRLLTNARQLAFSLLDKRKMLFFFLFLTFNIQFRMPVCRHIKHMTFAVDYSINTYLLDVLTQKCDSDV